MLVARLVAVVAVVCAAAVCALPSPRGADTLSTGLKCPSLNSTHAATPFVAMLDAGEGSLARCGDLDSSFLQTSETPKSIPIQQKFMVECQCTEQVRIPTNLKLPMEIPFGQCAATEVKVATKEAGEGLTAEDVRTAVGNPLKVKWAKIQYHHFSDWEGRTSTQILGLPGGDIAEFINALDAYEEMTDTYVRDTDCKRMLKKFLAVTKKVSFYMMTDTTAVNQLSDNVDIDNLDLRERPDSGEIGKLLDGLVLPQHNGCRFLRKMLMSPEDMDLRKGLPECAIRAFFNILWDKDSPEGKKLRLVELDGVGEEQAVVHVKTSAECTSQGVAPLVQPKNSDNAMFVVHQAAADVYRLELSEFMADLNEKVDAARMKDIMNANGEKYVNRAVQSQAQGKPVYEVSVL